MSQRKREQRAKSGHTVSLCSLKPYTAHLHTEIECYRVHASSLLSLTLLCLQASPSDKIYGIGLRPDDPAAQQPTLWKGENLLGQEYA